jgi:hypothetical protein
MMVANDILKQVNQPNGFAGMALLYQKEQLIPGSTQYTIHRYYSQAPAELEDTGMFIYHYNAKRPNDNYLELRFCITGNKFCDNKVCGNCHQEPTEDCEGPIKTVDILCSVDCWGEQQEYIRYGFQTDVFEKNFEFLLSKPWIRLGMLTTVNSLSIPTTVDLAKKYQQWNSVREIFWHPHLVTPDTSPFNPLAFDYTLWKSYLDNIEQYITNDTFNTNTTRKEFAGINIYKQRN